MVTSHFPQSGVATFGPLLNSDVVHDHLGLNLLVDCVIAPNHKVDLFFCGVSQ